MTLYLLHTGSNLMGTQQPVAHISRNPILTPSDLRPIGLKDRLQLPTDHFQLGIGNIQLRYRLPHNTLRSTNVLNQIVTNIGILQSTPQHRIDISQHVLRSDTPPQQQLIQSNQLGFSHIPRCTATALDGTTRPVHTTWTHIPRSSTLIHLFGEPCPNIRRYLQHGSVSLA